MALTEQTIVKQVAVLPAQSAINVQWANQVLRDDEVISETYHRKAYTKEQQAEFEAEVPGAAAYVVAVGW
tara:strand:- start:229 stop:438 length:210 start_codon:yes stop_codon:yes gene_type:complete